MNIRYFLGQVKKRFLHKGSNIFYLCKFLLNKIENNTILLIEPNNCHTELFPSFVKYLNTLGFNVEIIAAYEQKNNLPKLNVKNIYYFTLFGAKKALKFKKIKKYNFLIFTSYRLYFAHPDKIRDYSKVFEHFKINDNLMQKTAVTLHHIEDYDENIKKCLGGIILSKNLKEKGENLHVINPCHFKENTIKNKNQKTIFVSIGKLEFERKNAALLFNNIEKLKTLGIKDFRVDAIGDNTQNDVPKSLKDFINPLGKLSFEKLYKVLENADFYLPLLDPEIEAHLRYIKNGTSGSFQMIRGFLLPPLIHKAFGDVHGFDAANSIVYENNDTFLDALCDAINMENEKYLKLQKELLNSKNEICAKSIQNFKNLLRLN